MSSVEHAIKDFQRGKFVIVVDDETRENEGDLVIAAEKVTPSKINYMLRNGKGLICISMLPERLDELKIPLMVPKQENTEVTKCSFTVSVDHKNTSTGISAADRALTINALADKEAKAEDFNRPGHIFPLRYQEGGILKRPGHTEAAVDLAKLAKMYPASVICEILNEDGSTAKMDDLEKFAKDHKLTILKIQELGEYLK